MRVLFVKAVAGTAEAGDVKEVKRGFALNYLLPQKLAVIASEKVVEQVRQHEEAARRRAEKDLAEARQAADKLKKLTVTIYARTGETGRLHGSVTNSDIAQQLKREAGLDIDKHKITVEPPIKSLGPHDVAVELHPEVKETLKVVVAAQ